MPENPARWRSTWSEMERIHRQSIILCTMSSTATSAPAVKRPLREMHSAFLPRYHVMGVAVRSGDSWIKAINTDFEIK
jgi:hypothetical protein